MTMTRWHGILIALLLASSLSGQIPRLDFSDSSLGTGTFSFSLVTTTVTAPGSNATITIQGPAGAATALLASLTPPPIAGVVVSGVTVGIDWTNFFFLWDGLTNPAAPLIGPAGLLTVAFTVPPGLPIGTTVYLQAIVVGPPPSPFSLTNAIDVNTVVTPTPIQSTQTSSHPLAQTPAGGMLMITDQPTWSTFWGQHAPGVPLPPVSFSSNIVVAAFQGSGVASAGIQVMGAFVDPAGIAQVFTQSTFAGIPLPTPLSPAHIVTFPFASAATGFLEHRSLFFAP